MIGAEGCPLLIKDASAGGIESRVGPLFMG